MEKETKRTRATIDDDVHEAAIAFEGQTARKKVCSYQIKTLTLIRYNNY